MSIEVKIIGSSSGVIPVTDGLSFEDVCIQSCRDLDIPPLVRHLFALRNTSTLLFANPSDLVSAGHEQYELRLRFWPSLANIDHTSVGPQALNYLYKQVSADFFEGKITAFNHKSLQRVALGLAVTAMYCYMEDNCESSLNEVVTNYKKFVPKVVRHNANLKYSVDPIRRNLRQVMLNPPGEILYCKKSFLKQVAQSAPDYLSEKYQVKIEAPKNIGSSQNGSNLSLDKPKQEDELVDYELIIQPLGENPGIKLQSKKKTPIQHVCSIEEICFISIRKSDHRMEVSRINGVPQYFLMGSEQALKSCVGALNGYYRLMEKWTFDLCGEFPTPSLDKLKSLRCHGPVSDFFAYEKLRNKRQNKQGCFILRESQLNYDAYFLDVCLVEKESPTTFSIIKLNDATWTFEGLDCAPCSSVRELLATYSNGGILLGIPGFELKECLPSSETDMSDLLLCRRKPIIYDELAEPSPSVQLPVCIPPQSVQLYGKSAVQSEFDGHFTLVQRGVWRQSHDQHVDIARKLLKQEFRQSFAQGFLESVQKCLFWRCETLVHIFGIVLDANLSVVMEYFPLGPLDQYLQASDLPVIDLVEAATNLAKALFYLEEKNCVHGKIRCRNLMVASHTANSIRVKLSDPGILIYNDEELPWIPVEFYGSMELVPKRSTADVWACGTCMWEIFSDGRKPCAGFNKTQIVQSFMSGWRPPRPEKCRGEIYHIMIDTWCPDAYKRPKAQTVMRDINQILYDVYNSRSNVYEVVNMHHRSLNGSMASGLTEATTLIAISEDQDTISYQFQFDDQPLQDTHGSLNFLLSNVQLNGGSSLSWDDEGTSELAAEIYELDKNKLELGQVIGQGFYGEVRLGIVRHSDGTAETVAVKKLKGTPLNNPESVDLERECSIMRTLSHPNIVEIKAIVTDPSTMLVMEYFPMGSLFCYLRAQKHTITDQQLIKFATNVAEGMAYLAENNIVHRDLAARNILVANEDLVKISDFGLARYVGYSGYYTVRVNNHKLPMPWYAPESLAYWKFSAQSDVWSYGVTLYEMFSRGAEPNFVSGDYDRLLYALRQGRRLPCPPMCPQIIYRELMHPCWAENAHQRPSFNALLDKLRVVANQLQ